MKRIFKDARTALWHVRHGGFSQVRQWRSRHQRERGFEAPSGVSGVEGGWTGRRGKRRLSFAPMEGPTRLPRRQDLRVGVILDDFSMMAFRYEWQIVALDPLLWADQLSDLDMVFVESAWTGNQGLWRGKIARETGPSDSLKNLLTACRNASIPTVFWNKEDPPHYDDFLPAAKLFDFVFTSDANRLPNYRRDLGHDRVAVLPFAAQPAIHNPARPRIGWHERDVAFAGMYFQHRYPERRRQMELLLGGAMDASASMTTGLEIFSRQLGGRAEYQFPAPLSGRVVGSLTYAQMLSAYKAYKVFLNVNSVVDSPSMCARRIFEITASGTPVVTAPSSAILRFFSSAEILVAANRKDAENLTRALADHPELNDRSVHLAQRRIWASHTYAHRAEFVVEAVLPRRAVPLKRPSVSALVPTIRPGQLEHVFGTLTRQLDVDVQLVLLTHGFDLPASRLRELKNDFEFDNVVVISAERDVTLGDCLNRCVAAADGSLVAKMDDDDHYGDQYLSDQAFALQYSEAQIVGKQAHYMHLLDSNATLLRFGHREHRYTDFVMGPTIVAPREIALSNPFPSLMKGEDTGFLRRAVQDGLRIYSADRFNFYQVRSREGHTWQIDDAELLASAELKFYGEPNEHTDI